ncbi:MAG: ribonuclease P protein subunit [Vulcanisaeta sp.]
MVNSLLFKFITTTKCRNNSLDGINGIVIDETANTIKVLTLTGSVKTIIKEDCWFYVNVDGCTYLINGRKLITKGKGRKTFKFV